ncbi:RRXRR domain-containing protein [Cupriavidus basilensis]|uniref:RRXRR domain-containing protein n=1 Tax=Cupriavidus basilensis TaxID=68895 RepID=A0ABT6AW57_9BURK|nr:RRXRR domain-containing protein [Cupriavidus basilensis]MDF3836808.1 RRXRR domain-containing protein [Cupriavidus basilensis]
MHQPRRSRKPRYCAAQFDNQRWPGGWLVPRLQHHIDTAMAWVRAPSTTGDVLICPRPALSLHGAWALS